MRTIKLKFANGCTLANQSAKVGKTPSGAVIVAVRNIPDEVDNATVLRAYAGYFGGWQGDYGVDWHA